MKLETLIDTLIIIFFFPSLVNVFAFYLMVGSFEPSELLSCEESETLLEFCFILNSSPLSAFPY